ncbi:TNF receptor-associated factor 5-like [Dysidea avara]|uniref:TNF receptor-associated factor 5-like n=1 Tax=Dysidea avara TaxID=196820 RepID=UPI00332146EA
MSQFAEYKKKAWWTSEPFYSHSKGYKLYLRLIPAGIGSGKGTHLSIYLYLTSGPHDNELSWPLRGGFCLKLLNQISDCEHYSKTKIFGDHTSGGRVNEGDRDISWGYSQYISNEEFLKVTSKCQYLKDDCVFIQERMEAVNQQLRLGHPIQFHYTVTA